MTTMKKDDHTQVISHVLDNFQKYRTDVSYSTVRIVQLQKDAEEL